MATYTIIGSDQKPYSLVAADDIRRWIAEGRLNGQSLMKSESDAEFRPLSTFAEFAAALAATTAPETMPPRLSSGVSAPVKNSRLATASLVLGFLGLLTCGVTALIGLILGIIALVKIKQSRGALGGGSIALVGTIASGIILLMAILFITFAKLEGIPHAYRNTCVANIRLLENALNTYAVYNQNHYPAATNWCDALLQTDASLTNNFRCLADSSRSRCSYAFNAQLSGAEVSKVDPNTVVIFESSGGWNLSGGKELLLAKPRHYNRVLVLLAGGHLEQLPESELVQLRWNP
jgi:hypothetical protein